MSLSPRLLRPHQTASTLTLTPGHDGLAMAGVLQAGTGEFAFFRVPFTPFVAHNRLMVGGGGYRANWLDVNARAAVIREILNWRTPTPSIGAKIIAYEEVTSGFGFTGSVFWPSDDNLSPYAFLFGTRGQQDGSVWTSLNQLMLWQSNDIYGLAWPNDVDQGSDISSVMDVPSTVHAGAMTGITVNVLTFNVSGVASNLRPVNGKQYRIRLAGNAAAGDYTITITSTTTAAANTASITAANAAGGTWAFLPGSFVTGGAVVSDAAGIKHLSGHYRYCIDFTVGEPFPFVITWENSNFDGLQRPGICNESDSLTQGAIEPALWRNGDNVSMYCRRRENPETDRVQIDLTNSGATWSNASHQTELTQPSGTDGSKCGACSLGGQKVAVIGAADSTDRKTMKVWLSDNLGVTYPYSVVIDPGAAGYGEIVHLGNGLLACTWEAGYGTADVSITGSSTGEFLFALLSEAYLRSGASAYTRPTVTPAAPSLPPGFPTLSVATSHIKLALDRAVGLQGLFADKNLKRPLAPNMSDAAAEDWGVQSLIDYAGTQFKCNVTELLANSGWTFGRMTVHKSAGVMPFFRNNASTAGTIDLSAPNQFVAFNAARLFDWLPQKNFTLILRAKVTVQDAGSGNYQTILDNGGSAPAADGIWWSLVRESSSRMQQNIKIRAGGNTELDWEFLADATNQRVIGGSDYMIALICDNTAHTVTAWSVPFTDTTPFNTNRREVKTGLGTSTAGVAATTLTLFNALHFDGALWGFDAVLTQADLEAMLNWWKSLT